MREADGLAMSSRNRYLSSDERARAAVLPVAMRKAIAVIEAGAAVPLVLDMTRAALLAGGFASVDYVELADAETLEPLAQPGKQPARLFVAARIGGTRLIDNMAVGG